MQRWGRGCGVGQGWGRRISSDLEARVLSREGALLIRLQGLHHLGLPTGEARSVGLKGFRVVLM